jgi:hypothetical protein
MLDVKEPADVLLDLTRGGGENARPVQLVLMYLARIT